MLNSVKNLIKKNESIYLIALKIKSHLEPSQDKILKKVLQYYVNRFKILGGHMYVMKQKMLHI